MKVKDLKVEYFINPIGIDIKKPRFSWKLDSERKNLIQQSYQLIVTNNKHVVFDSGKVESDQSVFVPYEGEPLERLTEYTVNVKVEDNYGNTAETSSTFETGLFSGESFSGDWITHALDANEKAPPVFFTAFDTTKEVKQARLYITSLGIYDVFFNGVKVSDTYLNPGWTSYHNRLQYQTHVLDVKDTNLIEIPVANGWYKGPFGFQMKEKHYGDQVALLAEVHITYEDGTKDIIKTSDEWKVKTGQIRESEIYLGETIDSTYENSSYHQAKKYKYEKKHIIAQESDPVRITEYLKPEDIFITPKGEHVIDFGQNLAGFVELNIHGDKNQTITISHAETLDKEGNFYPETLRQAVSIDRFICNGKPQTFRPNFTFHGFRYIKVEGLDEINLADFKACVLHTDMQKTGFFETSNPLVNRLQKNIEWSQRGNFIDIPTDCPQRDERLGWTGDAQVFASTAAFNRDVNSFFKKWLHDLKAEQSMEYGVPHVVPNILGDQSGAAAWSDAATIIPFEMYLAYEDKQLLRDQYQSMKNWVDYIKNNSGENGLWQTGFQYGDWLALDKEESADRTGATDPYFVANAYYIYSTSLLINAAQILEFEEEYAYYSKLKQQILESFNAEYVTKTGRLVSETQTACTLALYFDLINSTHRKRVTQLLKKNINEHKNHLTTGFVGTPYLCHALSENGLHDLAGTLLLKEDYPSWLYAVKKGATTIWERWNSILPNGDFEEMGMNSLNHYAYGSIGDWMYKYLAGIQRVKPGYKKVRIEPKFIKGITSVHASLKTNYGEIKVKWKCEHNEISVDVTIPPNTTATIVLPDKDDEIEVGSGNYHYTYKTDISLAYDRFTFDSTLQEIMGEPLAIDILNQHAPEMLNHPMIEFAQQLSVSEILSNSSKESEGLFQLVIDQLNENS